MYIDWNIILWIGGIVGAITTIVGGAVAALRWAAKPLNEIKSDIKDLKVRVARVEQKDADQDWRIQDSSEQRKLLINGIHALLKNAETQGFDAEVTDAKEQLEEYLKIRPFK